jgi:hypothetical protein
MNWQILTDCSLILLAPRASLFDAFARICVCFKVGCLVFLVAVKHGITASAAQEVSEFSAMATSI